MLPPDFELWTSHLLSFETTAMTGGFSFEAGVLSSEVPDPNPGHEHRIEIKDHPLCLHDVNTPDFFFSLSAEDRVVVKVHRHNPVHHEDWLPAPSWLLAKVGWLGVLQGW